MNFRVFSPRSKEEGMRDDRVSAAFSGLVVCGVVVLGILCPRAAQAECSNKAAGAYLTTVKSGESIASRSTLILGADGTVSSVDSGQGPIGFTDAQGTWTCDRERNLVVTTLDFNTAGDTLFKVSYTASFDKKQQTVSGTVTLHSYPLAGDPFTDAGTPLGTFSFTGERIP
jgi:hypothetical protein